VLNGAAVPPEMRGIVAGGAAAPALTLEFVSGAVRGNDIIPITFTATPGTNTPPDTVEAIVSASFLQATESKVGDTLPVELGRQRRNVHIAGVVSAFPTLDPDGDSVVVVDLPTLEMVDFTATGNASDPEEFWIATAPGQTGAVADALSKTPYSSPRVLDRVERGKTLRTDPVALGIIGALSLGFVAAVLFAVIGFAVSAAVSSRERLTEFALLRALGLSTRQLSSWLSLENGLLVALSLAGGTGLGLLLAWLVLPLVSLTQAAGRVVPGVQVVVPWGTVALLETGMLLALVVVVGSLAWALRRVGLGSMLRLGEER
jgi:hypothetical protein